VAGIPFFDIYHYTVGEVEDFIKIQAESWRLQDRRTAQIAMRTASLVSRMTMGGEQQQFLFTEEFDWLFTPEEHREAKRQRLKAAIHVKETP
jgi:hypothetical protein